MVFFKNYFMDPAMRQNFAYAFAETHNLNLEVCHIRCTANVANLDFPFPNIYTWSDQKYLMSQKFHLTTLYRIEKVTTN